MNIDWNLIDKPKSFSITEAAYLWLERLPPAELENEQDYYVRREVERMQGGMLTQLGLESSLIRRGHPVKEEDQSTIEQIRRSVEENSR